MMKLSEDLAWRGLIKDKTFSDISWLDKPSTFYLGIDASADSLTVGNLAVLMLAKRLTTSGWKAVMLAGGATSLVGDPGGKTKERDLLPAEQISKNAAAISSQINSIMAGSNHEMVNNLEWLDSVKLLDFLRDIGKAFPVSELMQREFVSERLSTGISYAEFSYSLLQGYDFWWLNQNKDVRLQIGASDQWTNMLSGVSLVRKKTGNEVQAMSMPLVVNKQTGAKFGKSEVGAVWLDESKTSAVDFHQFWINTADDEVENYLKVFTLLSKDEIESIIVQHSKDPAKRLAQSKLADEVTATAHGKSVGVAAAGTSEAIAGGKPALSVSLKSGLTLAEATVAAGLAASNSEARRLIEDKGIYINDQPAAVEILNADDYENRQLILKRGKKLSNSVLIKLE